MTCVWLLTVSSTLQAKVPFPHSDVCLPLQMNPAPRHTNLTQSNIAN